MSNEPIASFSDPDDAPDMSTPYWVERIPQATIHRGRPKAARPKVSTTIRLSPEVIEHFRAGGPGWQSRIDEALRRVVREAAQAEP